MFKTKERKSQARKTSNLPTQVYAYGIHELSVEHRKVIHEQVFLAHQYRNKLVEIERERREAYRSIRRGLSNRLEVLEADYDKAQEAYLVSRKRLSS